ncbi:WD repeat and HMG-box DNA-binding protein 1-like [Centruroides sculpturatus]|uniref:WD repeat and HMG-box DNA-binding protein 1-like n=1 Tax=Centruroides sculpturatus TaxID=218467 RepID=UPI000C6ED792|nr:WD repeat and HMG-box DNA-binding protein 1-like [Centruroides sculpturatus]
MNPDGIITRFASQINSIYCSTNGKILLAGAGDFIIKAVDTTNSAQNIFEGHEAPILSVALDPQEYYIEFQYFGILINQLTKGRKGDHA